jgi:hypothetical protein
MNFNHLFGGALFRQAFADPLPADWVIGVTARRQI